MSWLQKKVGGARRRMIIEEDDVDIDLTYICQDRIIVMSFPASGFKTNWRNDYRDVVKYLD